MNKTKKTKICECGNKFRGRTKYCLKCKEEQKKIRKDEIKKQKEEMKGITGLISKILGEKPSKYEKPSLCTRLGVQNCGGGFRVMRG